MLSALNGFLILLDKKKTVMFVSDNVEDFLGLSQVEYCVYICKTLGFV